MLKKIIPLIFLGILFVVTYQVTKEEESAAISAIKEKLQKNINDDRPSAEVKEPPKNSPDISHINQLSDNSPRDILNENPSPSESPKAKAPIDKKSGTVASSLKRRNKKRIFPERIKSPPDPGSLDQSSSPAPAVGSSGAATTGASKRVLIVTENGEGESYLLMEALRMIRSGDKLQIRKGNYTFLMSNLGIPDIDITGEGEETVLEIPETLRLQQRNLSLKKIRLMNTGTSSAIAVSNGKKITAEDVSIIGNGNDCISVSKGDVSLTNVRIERCNRALSVGESTPVLNQVKVNDSDYGIYFSGTRGFEMSGITMETVNLFSIFFTSESSGIITCTGCQLTENASNRRNRLLLKK